MAKRSMASIWARSLQRTWKAAARSGVRAVRRNAKALAPVAKRAVKVAAKRATAPQAGAMISGVAMAAAGARRYQLFRPAGVAATDRLPLLVMLHGCTQDAPGFAASTRMNRIAARERFFVLYPEQDRRANPQRCWNWFGTASGQALGEAAILAAAVDQVCRLYPVDAARVAVAGLSAGASMAALLVTREPTRFKALVMHSGIPPGTAHSAVSALGAMRGRRSTAALPEAAPAITSTTASTVPAWPPLLVIHGVADATVAPANGRAAAQVWADALGARAAAARLLRRGQRHPMTATDFKRSGRTLVTLYEVDRLGHAWSGGNARQPFADAAGPDASRMVWAFAKKQFARASP